VKRHIKNEGLTAEKSQIEYPPPFCVIFPIFRNGKINNRLQQFDGKVKEAHLKFLSIKRAGVGGKAEAETGRVQCQRIEEQR
jgi:hypothetical protein